MQESKSRTAGWADAVEKSRFRTLNSGLKAARGYVGHKSAKMMKRAKSIEQRRERAIEQKSALLKNTEVDSPLNFIDLLSCIQIEDLIEEFQPTMLFVEHDKAFTEHIATRIVHIKAPRELPLFYAVW